MTLPHLVPCIRDALLYIGNRFLPLPLEKQTDADPRSTSSFFRHTECGDI
jgi:hypothetical protein